MKRVEEVSGVDCDAVDSRELIENGKAHREPCGNAVSGITKYSDVAWLMTSVCLRHVEILMVLIEDFFKRGMICCTVDLSDLLSCLVILLQCKTILQTF